MEKEFKAGDRVHVKRLDWEDVNFYATLEKTRKDGVLRLIDCSLKEYSGRVVLASHRGGFGNEDYYTLATDEEDTEVPEVQYIKKENGERRDMLMEIKSGYRVHVTSWNDSGVDFYATLRDTAASGLYLMVDTSNQDYEGFTILKPGHYHFGKNKRDFYTLATDEESPKERTINNLDANAYETKLIIEDEEGTEEPELQHIKRENKIELDNHYIIKMKTDSYVQEVTSNYYFRFTENIKRANVYEDKSDAIEHAELIGGRVLNLKRYVEVE